MMQSIGRSNDKIDQYPEDKSGDTFGTLFDISVGFESNWCTTGICDAPAAKRRLFEARGWAMIIVDTRRASPEGE